MTKIGKCLVVLTFVGAVGFLGFVLVALVGGPNWIAEANAMNDYVFTSTGGEDPQWVVAPRRSDNEFSPVTTPNLANAVVAARRDAVADQQERIRQLDEQIAMFQTRLAQARTMREADLAALEAREEELSQQLTEMAQINDELANQAIQLSRQSIETHQIGSQRRNDVSRLQAQLDELRTDKFRINQQIVELEDRLIRLKGATQAAERRNELLKGAGYEEPVTQ